MRLLTIGFKGKSAKEFFGTLKRFGVQKVIDVRRNNASQLAGFTKGRDLAFFLEECFDIAYEHVPEFAPSPELLKDYRKRLGKKKKDDAAWADYVQRFRKEVLSGPIVERFKSAVNGHSKVCLLCSEETADRCHRRLLAEHFRNRLENVELQHL